MIDPFNVSASYAIYTQYEIIILKYKLLTYMTVQNITCFHYHINNTFYFNEKALTASFLHHKFVTFKPQRVGNTCTHNIQ